MTEKVVSIITAPDAEKRAREFIVKHGFAKEKISLGSSSRAKKNWEFFFYSPRVWLFVNDKGIVLDVYKYFSEENAKLHKEDCGCNFCKNIKKTKET